jgi:hypothetical protein
MSHRHYGLRVTKSPASDTRPSSAGVWKCTPLLGGVLSLLIVLGVTLYRVTKTLTDLANSTTSAGDTTGR